MQTSEISALQIRPITLADCDAIATIIGDYARSEVLLWRTPDDIAEHAASFLAADLGGEIVGCVAVQRYDSELFELRSLAVRADQAGKGVGGALVEAAKATARQAKGRRLFALTTSPAYFLRHQFHEVHKAMFPQKVWQDCQLCTRRDRCIETAVVWEC